MIQFNYTLKELKAETSIAFNGAVICDTDSERLTRYIVKDVVNGIPILIEIGDNHKTVIPNWIGDYLRTGYLSVIDSGEHHISKPLADMKIGDYELSLIRKDLNI